RFFARPPARYSPSPRPPCRRSAPHVGTTPPLLPDGPCTSPRSSLSLRERTSARRCMRLCRLAIPPRSHAPAWERANQFTHLHYLRVARTRLANNWSPCRSKVTAASSPAFKSASLASRSLRAIFASLLTLNVQLFTFSVTTSSFLSGRTASILPFTSSR